ncbi:hypothetical protein EZS27_031964, partial [termite gut metagenome]
MKQYILLKLVFPVFCILFAVGISAQDIHSAYFLKGTSLAHRANPAFASEYNYVSFPILGNMYINTQTNVGLSTFLYSSDNPSYSLTTFLNKSVDGKTFLGKLNDNNRFDIDLNTTIFSAGFHAWGGFNTVEVGLKSNVSLNLPYDLFDFLKSGMKKATNKYDLKDLSIRSNNYVELALGHARRMDDYLVVGAKVKGLIGVANLDVKFDKMSITMSKDKWVITADGTLDAAIKGGQFETEPLGTEKKKKGEITGFKLNSPGIGGFGVGIDLGATYDLGAFLESFLGIESPWAENITVSAAILDLGFISWSNSLKGRTDGKPFTFDGFENIKIFSDDSETDDDSMDDQVDKITEELEGLVKF